MSGSTRSLSNPPQYYYELNTRQQRSWRHATRKMERNEQLKAQYPSYQPSSNIAIIHLHHRTKLDTIDQLIKKAQAIKQYTLDTESQQHGKETHGALIQIQFIEPNNYSTVIMIETYHLPDQDSLIFNRIQELCAIIFDNDNQIITWGSLSKELKNFHQFGLIDSGKTKNKTNLQSKFQDHHGQHKPHPAKESRDTTTGRSVMLAFDTPGDYDDNEAATNNDDDESKIDWSLQEAVVFKLGKFLNKEETINRWGCGLDPELETWRTKLFSKHHYNREEEQQKRSQMVQYAAHDCTAVTELFKLMYPSATTFSLQVNETTTSRKITTNFEDGLSDISDDEEIQILFPVSNEKPQTSPMPNNEQNQLIIRATEEELNELNPPEVQPLQQTQSQTTSTKLSKAEKQRKKNMKLKHKQRYHPEFQKKITRPIYSRYDYRKIRAQLLDDDIHTSHQITINWNKQEVTIGFKTNEQHERATRIIRANYFSKQQYERRWKN